MAVSGWIISSAPFGTALRHGGTPNRSPNFSEDSGARIVVRGKTPQWSQGGHTRFGGAWPVIEKLTGDLLG